MYINIESSDGRYRVLGNRYQRYIPRPAVSVSIADSIDILGPRLPTHTWRGRHMYEESKMASSTGQKTRELYYEKQVFGPFLIV